MMTLQIIYIANIIVAGWISFASLFNPERAQQTVFSGDFEYSEVIRLVGSLWLLHYLDLLMKWSEGHLHTS